MKILYFDCFAGASGNMILGALTALGVDQNELVGQLKLLDLAEFRIDFTRVDRSGISSIHAETVFSEEKKHRHLKDIQQIINAADISEPVKNRALGIFGKLAAAEAKVHGIAVEKVHFHEVGAMDAILDVVGACIGFEMLGIEKFVCSKIHVGSGFVEMAHGKFPVPPPAVAELLQNAPVYSTEITGELITPTGAAIISAVCEEYGKIPEMTIEKTAYGAGTREYAGFPNVIRLILGNAEPDASDHKSAGLLLLETNIDDLTPQVLGFVMEKAFAEGCLDCWFTAIQMKKNRPATLVSILCEPEQKEIFSELLFRETSTLGVRVHHIERDCLRREIVEVETGFGKVDVKIAKFRGKIINLKPEFDQLKEFAEKHRRPLREIEQMVYEKLSAEGLAAGRRLEE